VEEEERVSFMSIFPYAVGFLDLGAAIVYGLNKQWALAITWFCYAIAAVSLGSVKVD
jgi:hypothetical protein